MVNIFVLSGGYKCYKGADIVYIGHGLMDCKMRSYRSYMGNALCVAGPQFLPMEDFPEGVDIVKCGYLGFDNIVEDLDEIEVRRDSVLFAPYNKGEMEAMKEYVEFVLRKYKVIFRFREDFKEDGEEFCRNFAKFKNFYIDNGSGIALKTYKRAFCMICAATSSKNTFPMLSLCPVIVLPHTLGPNFGVDVDISIGINCKEWISAKEILRIIDEVYKNLPVWNKKILKYREENIYNFGKASESLADYLMEKYQL